MKGKCIRRLSVGSPNKSLSRTPEISTSGSRNLLTQKSELKTHETSSYLEVTALSPRDQSPTKLENASKMAADLEFSCHDVQKTTEDVMSQYLQDNIYCVNDCNNLSQVISARILEEIKQLGFEKYKMVAVVSIGSVKEYPGMQFGSRCLWNKDTDNFISAEYKNTSLFAVVMVYGLYIG